MRLVVKHSDGTVNEFQFTTGPVYIGRGTNSQIFLPDRTVSRHHAVIFCTAEGKWMAEDLDSANKTHLNGQPIHKAEIKTGDCLGIADYTIEINLEDDITADKPAPSEDKSTKTSYDLEDTLTTSTRELQIIVRKLDSKHAPDITLPAERIEDFAEAAEAICRANGLDEVLQVLLRTVARQFSASRTWCALRNQPTGPMTTHAGKKRSGESVQLSEIKLNEKITEALEESQFLLVPRIPLHLGEQRVHSAMIAPIMATARCFGVLYVDNAMNQPRYTLSDLAYLMFLSVHTAAILENF